MVRPELRIALPGVDEAKVDEIIQTTLNLQTDQTLDPLRVAHSFSAAEQRRKKQLMHRKVVMYYLSSEELQFKNMSTLSSYTELVELLAPSLMRAFSPNAPPVLGTYWGYCLRCCRTVRAVFSPGKEEPECLRAEGPSNQHILASEWKMKQLGE